MLPPDPDRAGAFCSRAAGLARLRALSGRAAAALSAGSVET